VLPALFLKPWQVWKEKMPEGSEKKISAAM
jgi:hypothetical protein